MAPQSALRFFKRVLLYCERSTNIRERIPSGTRGVYVLYKQQPTSGNTFDVQYIGIGGTGKRSGVGARIWTHRDDGKKPDWTHYSVFEVHDNISSEEIKELERFLLQIFKSDSRLKNVQFGSKKFKEISSKAPC